MEILSTAISLPNWQLSNQDVIDLIRYHSKPIFSGNLEKLSKRLGFISIKFSKSKHSSFK